MKKTSKNTKGKGEPVAPKGIKEGGGKKDTHTPLFSFFFKALKCLGCLPRSACFRSLVNPYLKLVDNGDWGDRLIKT